MSGTRLTVRVHDRAQALERLIGQIRRRVLPVRRLSIAESDGEMIELQLRLADDASVERVSAALLELYDVAEVTVDDAAAATRELVLVRLRPDAAVHAAGVGRLVAIEGEEIVLEITGAPDEVERVLAGLREQQLITGFVRSGEVAVPGEHALQTRSPS